MSDVGENLDRRTGSEDPNRELSKEERTTQFEEKREIPTRGWVFSRRGPQALTSKPPSLKREGGRGSAKTNPVREKEKELACLKRGSPFVQRGGK